MAATLAPSVDYVATFARQLKAAREARKLSQRQLGTLAGCSGSIISRYERASHEDAPALPNVMRLALALRVNLDWLLLGTGPRDSDAPIVIVQLNALAPSRLREIADELEGGLRSVVTSD